MPLAYHGTTIEIAREALKEGLKAPAPTFTEDHRRAARNAEAVIAIDPEKAGLFRAPGYAIPRWYTPSDISADAIVEVEVF